MTQNFEPHKKRDVEPDMTQNFEAHKKRNLNQI